MRSFKIPHSAHRPLYVLYGLFCLFSLCQVVGAAPFGEGVFGAHVPFGSATSISIALTGGPSLALTPGGSFFSASGSHTVTVTSTDPVGYNLYAYCLSSCNMVNGSSTIPASGNISAGALATNTWGYNTDGSTNYLGMLTTPSLIKAASGPFETGDTTTITYAVLTDITQSAGSYTVSVVYTAVAMND